MKGRKPKPTALKVAQGNPGKRKLREEPALPSDAPACPAHLTASARDEWERLIVMLHTSGMVKATDRAALAAYCQAWGDWVDARKLIARITPKQMATEEGWAKWKSAQRVSSTAVDQMRRWAVELGLTPSARARVKAEPPADKGKSLAEMLFGDHVEAKD